MPAAPAGQYWWVVDLALVVIVVCIGGVVLSLFMPCFALLVSWLFASLKYSRYLCWREEKSMVCDNFKPTLFLDKALNY